MSVTFPTLDLGELGAQIDALIVDDEAIPVEDATSFVPEPVVEAVATDAADDEVVPSGEPEAPAAVAEDDFEARFTARFEAEYAERSKEDIRKLQQKLDPQIASWRGKAQTAESALEEAEGFATFLAEKLAEYDPDEVQRFVRNRQGLQARDARERVLVAREQEVKADRRSTWYAQQFAGAIDPNDPELREAFERGDSNLERRLLDLKYRELQLRAPQVPAKAAPVVPAVTAAVPRAANGQFLSVAEQRVQATRALEASRGPAAPKAAAAASTKLPANATQQQIRDFGRSQMARGFAALGLAG